MPRNGRGGKRVGRPGTAYAQRTDLLEQPIRTAPNQPYGHAKAQADAQRAMPLAQVQGAPPSPMPGAPGEVALGGLYAKSTRPDEPVQAGLPIGPGPGPMWSDGGDDLALMEAIAQRFPTSGVWRVVEALRR
jgi:hypothetical protein